MSILSNVIPPELRPRTVADAPWVAWPYTDTLYDYTKLLGRDKLMGRLPPERFGTEVAVIGAGVAGMVAAYELLRVGCRPVIFEATDRIGGRSWSLHFTERDGSIAEPFAEMGAMRVPVSAKTFGYYADLFGMTATPFPDPGVVDTLLYYQNRRYDWQGGKAPPGLFGPIAQAFNGYITPLLTTIWTPWQAGDMDLVRDIWQRYINEGALLSFYQALKFGIPSWGVEDFNAFGALGVGSGGFGPFYPQELLELLRLLVNQWDTDQKLYEDGLNTLTDAFYTTKVVTPSLGVVSLEDLRAVHLSTPVRRLERGPSGAPTLTIVREGREEQRSFPAVVLATTTYAMEMIGVTLDSGPTRVLPQPVRSGIRGQHINSSSKMFIRTETKFWKDDASIPATIQTDELPRGVYLLDYPQTDNGVVLLSYTWADDSVRLAAVPTAQRFALFREILGKICPPLAEQLVPMNGEILNVDWQNAQFYHGAFKSQFPGQEPYMQNMNYQFLSVLDPVKDQGVYLAGDSVSWSGGWMEGALQTGLNAVSSVIQRIGGTPVAGSPLTQNPNLYNYGRLYDVDAVTPPAPRWSL